MSFTSELSDFASRIRVAQSSKDLTVTVRLTKLTVRLSALFYRSGFIKSFSVVNSQVLLLFLKYHNQLPLLRHITVLSSPGRRLYWNLIELSRVINRQSPNTIYILSTTKGLCTSTDCLLGRRRLLGGEVFFQIQLNG